MTNRPPHDYAVYRDEAVRIAHQAGTALVDLFGRVEIREKAPFDLITQADLASQSLIAQALARSFPDHTLMAEEENQLPDASNPWRWIVDPLDGTINFAHGLPLWCVSMGLEHAGQLVAGVVHLPLLNETYSAALHQGARLNGRPLRVSHTPTLEASLIATGMPTSHFEQDADRQMAFMRRLSTRTHSVRRTGSSAWNLALVAAGGFDCYYATAIHPWDAAAGVVLVREAGGRVTNLDGSPYDLYQPTILASNGLVHGVAAEALARAWPGS